MPGDRRKRAHNGESDTADAKRYQPDSTTGDTQGAQMSQQMHSDAPTRPGGAGVGGDGENSTELVQQILRVPRDHGVVTVFRDSKILTTWAYAMLKTNLVYDTEKTFPGVLTSLSRLPVDRPYLYIPHGTYLNLPAHTRAVSCSVKVTPHGLRTPWKTGSSVVQPVNSDMLVYGLSSVGLNHYLDTGMCRVKKGETNNPMKPQSYLPFQEKDHSDLAKSYWGLKITPGNEDDDGDDEKSIPACMGVPRHNFAYDFIHIHKASPRLTKFVNQFPFKGHVGTPIVNYEYQFGSDAWLKMGPTYNAGNELLTRTHLGLPADVVSYTTSNMSNYESYEQKPDTNITMRLRPDDMHTRHVKYLDPMENTYFTRGLKTMAHSTIQPSLSFGVLAVSKSNKDDPGSTETFQDIAAFFQIDTELVVHSDVDTIVADSVTLPSNVGPYLRHSNENIKASYNSLTRHGRPVNLARTESEVTEHKAELQKIAQAQINASKEVASRTLRSVPFFPQ
ncbi:uncharacterized protein LOC119375396 [Rhipicephalus sanguineus]|uniref:uncharacterized protein LOC119375396 n=1 Tax=Rhipicephalus sanguineus TaxID=34632 RepID=UPI0020C32FAA|nr:uncharacterized protein LOC119375396 [Rhipicephalus sanguineus]